MTANLSKRGSSDVSRQPRHQRRQRVLNPGLIIIDGDNLNNHLRDRSLTVSPSQLVGYVTAESTGIDKVVRTCLFTTNAHTRKAAFGLDLDLPEVATFCHHNCERHVGENGYPDDDMYLEAWQRLSSYKTLLIITNDGGAEEFASELRRGYNRFTGESNTGNGNKLGWRREVMIMGSNWGRTHPDRWAENLMNLDYVLRQIM